MTTKTVSLEDLLPQLPIKKIRKIYDNYFQYFSLGDNVVVGNGHIFFVLNNLYLETIKGYHKQLQSLRLSGQIEITDFRSCYSDSVEGFLANVGYKEPTKFNPDLYTPEYLEVVKLLTTQPPIKTVSLVSETWKSQTSVWVVSDALTVILTGLMAHK